VDRVTLSSLNSSTGAPCTGRLSPRRTAPARTTRPTHAAVARPETVAYELALLLLADNPPTGTSVATTRDARSLSSTRATVLRGHPAPPIQQSRSAGSCITAYEADSPRARLAAPGRRGAPSPLLLVYPVAGFSADAGLSLPQPVGENVEQAPQ